MKKFAGQYPFPDFRLLIAAGLLQAFFCFLIVKETPPPAFLVQIPLFLAGLNFFIAGRPPEPEICFFALAAYIPFSKQLAFGLGNFPSPIAACLVLGGMALWSLWLEPGKKIQLNDFTALSKPAAVFLIWSLVSVARGISLGANPLQAFYEFLRIWIVPMFIFYSAYHSLERKDMSTCLGIMLLALGAVSATTIFEFLTAGDVKFDQSRAGGISNDPNILAVFLNYMMFISLAFFFRAIEHWQGWLFSLPFLTAFRAMLGTFSRGGYLAFVAGVLTVSWFRSKILFILIVAFGIFLIQNPRYLPHSMQARIQQTLKKNPWQTNKTADLNSLEKSLDRSNSDRIEIWKGAIQIIKEHPVMGVGYSRFVDVIADYWIGKVPFEAHNTFLFIGAEMGVPGLVLFLLILLTILVKTILLYFKPSDMFDKALAQGFLGSLAALLPSHLYVIRLDSLEVSVYFWILTAMIFKLTADRPLSGRKISKEGMAVL